MKKIVLVNVLYRRPQKREENALCVDRCILYIAEVFDLAPYNSLESDCCAFNAHRPRDSTGAI